MHDYKNCNNEDCEECDALVRWGFIICCDFCYEPGHTDSHGWRRQADGRIACLQCSED